MQKLKPDEIEVEGEVIEALPDLVFRVTITKAPEELLNTVVLGKVSGQMRMFKIRVMPGDKVKMTMTKYDKTRGRITFRTK